MGISLALGVRIAILGGTNQVLDVKLPVIIWAFIAILYMINKKTT